MYSKDRVEDITYITAMFKLLNGVHGPAAADRILPV